MRYSITDGFGTVAAADSYNDARVEASARSYASDDTFYVLDEEADDVGRCNAVAVYIGGRDYGHPTPTDYYPTANARYVACSRAFNIL